MNEKSGAGSALRMNFNRSLEMDSKPADPDLPLVQAFRSGQTMAFDRLYERHSAFVYNTCLGILGNPEDARDAMQEIFVQVYRSLPKFQGKSKFSTWVYRIAVNKCHDALRRCPRYETTDSLDWVSEGQSDADAFAEAQVRSTILKLSPDHREVLVLHYFQQLSYQEIAESLSCSVDQVRMRLFRARQAFRQLYDDRGDEIEV